MRAIDPTDKRDAEILAARIACRAAIEGPRVGDYIDMLDGTRRRFTHDWGDGFQTTVPRADASFHIWRDGQLDFSGSLDKPVPRDRIADTGATADGSAWFFHHGFTEAHGGIVAQIPCRVYRQMEGAPQ